MKRQCRRSSRRAGFTLIELLAVLAILGLLVSLIMPAVQQAREAARRTQCKNNLHQLGVAIHAHAGDRQLLPEGADYEQFRYHSWCTRILPLLDQANLFNDYDWSKAWDDATANNGGRSNQQVTQTPLSVFRCPSNPPTKPGASDYGGCYGTSLTGLTPGYGAGEGWEAGLMVVINPPAIQARKQPVSLGEVHDGLSQTFLVLECATPIDPPQYWGNGGNCLPVETGINFHLVDEDGDDAYFASIFSTHTGGGHALFGDGRVAFLSDSTDLNILAALSTRSRSEVVNTNF
ncbi:DUF1559 domain-containing protein [Planctomicrobium piriforme]|uniref:Prepilin-type N-terminal cleavage/methylation domain-containing protein n=1 Tax=Planctomicrobium piriforme TaxID=1576369 RepID=A0A1I3FV86_9PLAN|nr:DUF1559 domain-containing protein [Planctomicrobium piriforme]SFI14841.1 prepilin-type N-terminal cleavage/methylation domain-containing protein [Planctomicrobium piriforme]